MPPVGKIAKLPGDIRKWLHQTLVDRAFGDITGVTDELRDMLKQAGISMSIGRSTVGDESARIKRAAEAIKAATEATRLIAETARDDEDTRSEAALALVQTDVFETLMVVRESEAEKDPAARLKLLDKAALTLTRTSRARVAQARWRQEVEERAKAAADAVAKITKTGGLTPEQQNEIRARILGITKVPAKTAGA
ncbi:hypothetical protein VITFI_CDS1529 [Vitreoscilla filiformis]|uniref:Uncharacterized protein n=1 Tax=Vitreoscilla filiformis TaxID=63 RepID=A0A221KCS1_VITFI|nr:phage protein Gp27 family protein [Vitreoscilla filiformis]ASM75894.1 hypothetical protein VITFI_CDS0115 [Vitreoscilla filiformis]ASM76432.1 hypothetical protein VITFI_CDS0653 [Vitreoscilla filiformis]ASM76844.1 hypothetical protein VITFI_CDS1066 [Vitreoscilla filiformis]ASM77307.1 hypothetical protein VITFI_CDS1529 [Vitreoscilla filiformis]